MNKQMKRYLGRGPEDSQGSVLVELGYATFPAHGYVHQLRSSPNPVVKGLLWLYDVGMIDY